MKKFFVGVFSGALLIALPLMSQAASLGYQGTMARSGVKVVDAGGNTANNHTIVEMNAAGTPNMSFAFNNVSGIVRMGEISFKDTGMWIGFGGTALTPKAGMFLGTFQSGGVVRLTGDVSYDMSSNTYTGSGTVVEFVGTMALSGNMRKGWGGQYGTPGAGPGGGWMPGWGGMSGGSMMPGWGGSTSNWGMMGAYGGVKTVPGGTGYMAPGGGMMGGGGNVGGGGMMGGGGNVGGGGMMGGGIPANGMAGMVMMWVSPTTAAIIPVNNGTPDHSNPTPVYMNITLPPARLTVAP